MKEILEKNKKIAIDKVKEMGAEELQKVNIFKNKQLAPTVELLDYILKDLEERKIIAQVKD